MNAPQLLEKEASKLKDKGRGKTIWFSSVTDPYQGLEAKYQLTRKCLQVLVDMDFQGEVTFLTKSDLVLRDLDVLKQLKHVEVGLTITSADDSISRYFEKYAPAVSQRLAALKKLHQNNIPIYAFVGPLLPHFVANHVELKKIFQSIHDAGVREIYFEFLNLSTYIRNRLKNELRDLDVSLWNEFYDSQSGDYRQELTRVVLDLVDEYGLTLRMEKPLYHKEMK